MAREHARVLTSIWSDGDFRARLLIEQWLFVRVISDKHINNAGVLPLWESRWARAAADLTQDEVEKARRGLTEHRFLIVDEDTDEALVRSFMRGDGVWRQPNVLKNALREAQATESPLLRAALADELVRIGGWLPTGKGYEGLPAMLDETVRLLDPQRSPNPTLEPSPNPSEKPRTNGHATPKTNPSPNPSGSRGVGEGVGEGAGVSPSRGGPVGGSRARETAAAPSRPSASGGPPPLPSELDQEPPTALAADQRPGESWPEQPCGSRHDPERPCRRCAVARKADEQATSDADQAERDRRAAVARQRRDCSWCDETGWIERDDPRAPAVRCDHVTLPAEQLANASVGAS